MNASQAPGHAPLLIVDDDADIRNTMQTLFESEGFPIVGVDTIAEAQTYLRRAADAHVVLLDFLLTPENADSLLSAAEQEATLRRHRYLLIPATPPTRFSQEAQQLIATVCTEVILKPFDLSVLLAAVARAEAQLSASSESPQASVNSYGRHIMRWPQQQLLWHLPCDYCLDTVQVA